MADGDGIDPLYDLGPLPGGDILFRADATDDVLGSALSTPTASDELSMLSPTAATRPGGPTHTGVESEPSPESARSWATSPAAPEQLAPPRQIPPPQTYSPGGRAGVDSPILDARRGLPRDWSAGRAVARSRSGSNARTAARWAVRYPRLALALVGATFFFGASLLSSLSLLKGDESARPDYPTVESAPEVDPGLEGMSYYPWAVPTDVDQWRIEIDNHTDGSADFSVEDETTGEVLGSGTSAPGATAVYEIPADRLEDRIVIVQEASSGVGLVTCRILADDEQVGSAASMDGLNCVYDPDSLTQ